MEQKNVILEKSMELAVRIVRVMKYLESQKQEYVMSKQLMRSGTSIGANVHEAIYAQSRNDFVSKMSIALKEASETKYWVELLKRTEYLSKKESVSLDEQITEIVRLLTSIVKSSKKSN